jgi:DNA-binding XRE family transcriptional regulator
MTTGKTPTDSYAPIKFNPQAYARKRQKHDPAFARSYAMLEDEFAALDILLQLRKASGLTQAEVAENMGVKPSALARIEASITQRTHTPTLATLRKYAAACGKVLTIQIT